MNKFLPIIMSGILALPTLAFAASSVRTLGGAGTYNGVTSVGSGTATRAGSIRAVPSVKVSNPSVTTSASTSGSTGTVSGTTGTGTGTRMSIGKYLSGSGVVSSKVSTSAAATELADDISGLTSNLDDLAKQVDALESSDERTKTELEKIWKSLDDAATELDTEYLTKAEIEALLYIDETELEKALTDLKLEEYAKKDDIPTPTNIADIIAGAVESGDLELSGYAKTSVLENYAKTSDLNTGFEQVSVELTNVDNKITDINTKIENLDVRISSFSVYPGPFDPTNLD